MAKRIQVQPPDHSVKSSRHGIPKSVAIATIFLLLWPYTLSFGDDGLSFTLINGTSHYLHAVINGKQFAYIVPGGVVKYGVRGYADVTAFASYSPGQDVKGSTSKTFQTVVVTVDNYSSTNAHDCSGNHGANTCTSSTQAGGESTTSVSPISWMVTPSDLQSN